MRRAWSEGVLLIKYCVGVARWGKDYQYRMSIELDATLSTVQTEVNYYIRVEGECGSRSVPIVCFDFTTLPPLL